MDEATKKAMAHIKGDYADLGGREADDTIAPIQYSAPSEDLMNLLTAVQRAASGFGGLSGGVALVSAPHRDGPWLEEEAEVSASAVEVVDLGTCEPGAGAEVGSLHWVESPRIGRAVWQWCGSGQWRHDGVHDFAPCAYLAGWRYLGPAGYREPQPPIEPCADPDRHFVRTANGVEVWFRSPAKDWFSLRFPWVCSDIPSVQCEANGDLPHGVEYLGPAFYQASPLYWGEWRGKTMQLQAELRSVRLCLKAEADRCERLKRERDTAMAEIARLNKARRFVSAVYARSATVDEALQIIAGVDEGIDGGLTVFVAPPCVVAPSEPGLTDEDVEMFGGTFHAFDRWLTTRPDLKGARTAAELDAYADFKRAEKLAILSDPECQVKDGPIADDFAEIGRRVRELRGDVT